MLALPTLKLLVQKHFPQGRLLRALPLAGGSSAEMTALEVTHPDGEVRRWILRQPGEAARRRNPHAAEHEFRLLQILQAHNLPAPQPYALDASGDILDASYLITAWIEAQPDFSPADPVGAASQLAAALAQIHAVDASVAELAFLPWLSERTEIQRENEREAALDTGSIRNLLMAAAPFLRRNRLALLHGDFWPGNVLWQAGQLAAVIDWEDAARGEPLADLSIARLDHLYIYGREVMEALTRHYLALLPIDTGSLPYWDLHAALRLSRLVGTDLHRWAEFFHSRNREDITAHSIREHYQYFIGQALEKLGAW